MYFILNSNLFLLVFLLSNDSTLYFHCEVCKTYKTLLHINQNHRSNVNIDLSVVGSFSKCDLKSLINTDMMIFTRCSCFNIIRK